MADLPIPASSYARLMRRGLMFCGAVVAFVIIYVASIGPLALLERQGVGTQATWESLHGTVYHPIFHSWQRGPRWVSSSLRWYVGLFVAESSGVKSPDFDMRRCFAADTNNYWRWYYFFSQAAERTESEYTEFKAGSPMTEQQAKQISLEIKDLL